MFKVSFQELIRYSNSKVTRYHTQKSNIPIGESERRLKDWLAWGWLMSERKQQGKKSYFFGPLLPLDYFWHDFILHTREYETFCGEYLTTFLHHDIEPEDSNIKITSPYLEDYLEDAFNILGDAWVMRNFKEAFMVDSGNSVV